MHFRFGSHIMICSPCDYFTTARSLGDEPTFLSMRLNWPGKICFPTRIEALTGQLCRWIKSSRVNLFSTSTTLIAYCKLCLSPTVCETELHYFWKQKKVKVASSQIQFLMNIWTSPCSSLHNSIEVDCPLPFSRMSFWLSSLAYSLGISYWSHIQVLINLTLLTFYKIKAG